MPKRMATPILDGTSMDWRDEYLRDPQRTEARLARAPVLLPPGRMLTLDRRGELEPLGAMRSCTGAGGSGRRTWRRTNGPLPRGVSGATGCKPRRSYNRTP